MNNDCSAYRLEVHHSRVLVCGYPRKDLLLKEIKGYYIGLEFIIRQNRALPESDKVVLCAPTLETQLKARKQLTVSEVKCPLCQGTSVRLVSRNHGPELWLCKICEFGFFYPMVLPTDSQILFNNAYAGRVTVAQMSELPWRLLLREDLLREKINPERLLTGAQREALRWIKSNVALGGSILDIGVGTGHFVRALKNSGFDPTGLDVAEEPVRVLEEDGFKVWRGTIDTVPDDWPEPKVCTVFYVLHHIPDPMAFLRVVRSRFPIATLVIGQHNTAHRLMSPEPQLKPQWYPPRTLSFWGPKSLRNAMQLAGYTMRKVGPVAKTPSEYGIPGTLNLFYAQRSRFRPLLRLYYTAKPVLFGPVAVIDRLRDHKTSVLSIGSPA